MDMKSIKGLENVSSIYYSIYNNGCRRMSTLFIRYYNGE